MSVHGADERPGVTPPLPGSIWLVAWGSLAGQVLLVVRHGGRVGDEVSQVLSIVIGSLLVGYVSAGVVRARRFRMLFAWVGLALGVIGGLADLVSVDELGRAAYAVLALAAGAVSLVGLAMFCRSDWYAWQRTRPSVRQGASIRQLVLIGVLVGALGGYVGLVDGGLAMRVHVNVG